MIQRHKRYPEHFEPDRRVLLDALRACRNAVIDSQRRLRPNSEAYRLGRKMIEAIDDLVGELTGDREVFRESRIDNGACGCRRHMKSRGSAKSGPSGNADCFSNH
jgi:hypothetical protein